jgi:hypothetical protein
LTILDGYICINANSLALGVGHQIQSLRVETHVGISEIPLFTAGFYPLVNNYKSIFFFVLVDFVFDDYEGGLFETV